MIFARRKGKQPSGEFTSAATKNEATMQDFRSQGGVQHFVASVLATQDSII
jgi:hypothetical protein